MEDGKVEWQSHNTGVVNFAYNNRELPSQVAKLALVHEIGHSLGSPVSTQLHLENCCEEKNHMVLDFSMIILKNAWVMQFKETI